jgi:hypothetical protein
MIETLTFATPTKKTGSEEREERERAKKTSFELRCVMRGKW